MAGRHGPEPGRGEADPGPGAVVASPAPGGWFGRLPGDSDGQSAAGTAARPIFTELGQGAGSDAKDRALSGQWVACGAIGLVGRNPGPTGAAGVVATASGNVAGRLRSGGAIAGGLSVCRSTGPLPGGQRLGRTGIVAVERFGPSQLGESGMVLDPPVSERAGGGCGHGRLVESPADVEPESGILGVVDAGSWQGRRAQPRPLGRRSYRRPLVAGSCGAGAGKVLPRKFGFRKLGRHVSAHGRQLRGGGKTLSGGKADGRSVGRGHRAVCGSPAKPHELGADAAMVCRP